MIFNLTQVTFFIKHRYPFLSKQCFVFSAFKVERWNWIKFPWHLMQSWVKQSRTRLTCSNLKYSRCLLLDFVSLSCFSGILSHLSLQHCFSSLQVLFLCSSLKSHHQLFYQTWTLTWLMKLLDSPQLRDYFIDFSCLWYCGPSDDPVLALRRVLCANIKK